MVASAETFIEKCVGIMVFSNFEARRKVPNLARLHKGNSATSLATKPAACGGQGREPTGFRQIIGLLVHS